MAEKSKDAEKTWATLCHLASFAGYIFPFGNIIGPLILWLIKKEEMPLVDREGKKSLNFQISISVYFVIAFLLVFVIIGFVLLFAIMIFDLIVVIMAAIKTNKGEDYHYPLSIQFLK